MHGSSGKDEGMKTILIVDDEPITRMDLRDMLTELGFHVAGEASDGFDAIEFCRAKHPDVVLMDVKMPIFDGLTASETILTEDLAGCVVLLTAFSDRDIIDRASAAGVTGYLVKPVNPPSLLPTLEVAMSQAARLRQSRAQTAKAEKLLENDRLIHKAQQHLARQQGCSETEAYHQMRKAAMDKRMGVAALAEAILKGADRSDDVAAVKSWLMKHKNMSEDRAHQFLLGHSRTHGCSIQQAARDLRRSLMKEG